MARWAEIRFLPMKWLVNPQENLLGSKCTPTIHLINAVSLLSQLPHNVCGCVLAQTDSDKAGISLLFL